MLNPLMIAIASHLTANEIHILINAIKNTTAEMLDNFFMMYNFNIV